MTRNVLKDERLWLLFGVIGLFQLGSSAMLPLLGQRVVAQGAGSGTNWMSACVIVAQLTMVPVALATGWLADRLGRRTLLVAACAIAVARCGVAMFAGSNWWLVPIEVLDGLGAGIFSVAVPVAVADLTYGSGRTQTAMGVVGTMLAGGAALASFAGGLGAQHLGYAMTFGIMGVFPAGAILLLMMLNVTGPAKAKDQSGKPSGKAASMSAAA